MENINRIEPQSKTFLVPKSTRPRYQARPHQTFAHARESRYPAHGRKFRGNQKRMRRVARMLSRFGDRAYASAATMIRELRNLELRHPEGDRLTWSRPTLFRTLKLLEKDGIAVKGAMTWSHKKRTRSRTLLPDKLLASPRECETFDSANVRRNKAFEPKTFRSQNVKSDETEMLAHSGFPVSLLSLKEKSKPDVKTKPKTICGEKANVKTARQRPVQTAGELKKNPAAIVEMLNCLTPRYLTEARKHEAPECFVALLVAHALRPTIADPDCSRRIRFPVNYAIRCAEELLDRFEPWLADIILDRRDLDELPRITEVKDGDTHICWTSKTETPNATEAKPETPVAQPEPEFIQWNPLAIDAETSAHLNQRAEGLRAVSSRQEDANPELARKLLLIADEIPRETNLRAATRFALEDKLVRLDKSLDRFVLKAGADAQTEREIREKGAAELLEHRESKAMPPDARAEFEASFRAIELRKHFEIPRLSLYSMVS